MPEPKFTPRNYYEAAKEHLGIASQALNASKPQYFVVHYFSGLAVEDILRALSASEGETFDHSHSIEYWALKANMLLKGSDERQQQLRNVLQEINDRWRANQRHYTYKMLDTYLEFKRLDKIRGDRVKHSSKRLFELATQVVTLGVEKWESKNKSNKS